MPVSEPWIDPTLPPETIPIDTSKCTKCQLNVYKNEEILAAARHWHKTCFTCGGTAAGKKTSYKIHCHVKVMFRPVLPIYIYIYIYVCA
jgi:hypothetical protein